MKTLALIADDELARTQGLEAFEATIHGNRLPFALMDIARPEFDPDQPEHRNHVLVQVVAASCNYRDAGLLLHYHELLRQSGQNTFIHFGSDFTGIVEATGCEVTSVGYGDRVIPDATYPQDSIPTSAQGVPTNHATRGWLILPSQQVRVVPAHLEPSSAAVLGLNSQTAASMVRKAGVGAGDRVLVTAGRSNTSLSVLAQLSAVGAHTTVLSTGEWSPAQKAAVGRPRVVQYAPESAPAPFSSDPIQPLEHLLSDEPAFDAVIDPFFDLFLLRVLPYLAHGGTYVTCGLKNQHKGQTETQDLTHRVPVQDLYGALSSVMVKNQKIVGNCIGTGEDLGHVVEALAEGKLKPVVDSIFSLDQSREFLERSFQASDRFGKVVLDMDED